MSNSLGLFLIGLGIGLLIVFVIVVQYLAKNHSNKRIGQIAQKIDQFIDQLPDD
jgi:riboflavin transporter FmnP